MSRKAELSMSIKKPRGGYKFCEFFSLEALKQNLVFFEPKNLKYSTRIKTKLTGPKPTILIELENVNTGVFTFT